MLTESGVPLQDFRCAIVLVVAFLACARPPAVTQVSPEPAAQFIAAAFTRHPLVAFSEPGHGASGTREFLAALIRHPGFAGTVTDIVIECGNARYQAIADRYFAGEPVPHEELRQIWENTTIVSGVWQLPMYEGILADIRAFNMTLPQQQRIRVVLGDPPIDWTVVRGPADEDMNDWRDAHFAWVVQEQVMNKGRKALLWIGGAHTGRKVIMPESLIHLLDRRFPGQTLVVDSIDREKVSPSVAARLGTWPSLSALSVRGTWLGQLNVQEIGRGLSRGLVEDDVDALVFWDSAPASGEGSTTTSDTAELRRRQQLAQSTLPFRGGKIRFQPNSAKIAPQSEQALGAVLAELNRDAGLQLLVKAFADARETDGLALSLERAKEVVRWLTIRGVNSTRLIAKGCGSSRALWIGDTEEERAANRRADLVRNSQWQDCIPPSSFDFR
jgi:outer membrane protein OmpA-like peptidoglycan-associated protein